VSQLTIGIPTYNRPHLLPRALRTALHQSIPVRVIVADDGDPGPTAELLASAEFADRDIVHLVTDAECCWANWRACALACETEYFAWLQDDDVVRDTFAERIVDVLDFFPDSNLWMARLASGFGRSDQVLGLPYKGSSPWVPMDLLEGKPARWMGGEILAATSYLTSWTLCPGQAYRVNDHFVEALASMPENSDMFIERLFPARLAVHAPIVVDPIIAGYWIQHARNLSARQSGDAAEVKLQLGAFLRSLDSTMDWVEEHGTDWRSMCRRWLAWIPPDILGGWLKNVQNIPEDVARGRYLDQVVEVMSEPFTNIHKIEIPVEAAEVPAA
jgi:glycosyltransferase involved in cell wall biosynthesis